MSESFAELFEESLSYTQMKPGSLVNASVIDVRSDFIIVSAGLKSEGVIPAEQFKNEKGEITVQVGDFCLLYTSPSPRDKRQSRMPSSA